MKVVKKINAFVAGLGLVLSLGTMAQAAMYDLDDVYIGSVKVEGTTGELVLTGPSTDPYFGNPASCGVSYVLLQSDNVTYMKEQIAMAMLANTTGRKVSLKIDDASCAYNDVDGYWYILGYNIRIFDSSF